MRKNNLFIVILFSLLLYSCSKSNTMQDDKSQYSIEQNTINVISQTDKMINYQILESSILRMYMHKNADNTYALEYLSNDDTLFPYKNITEISNDIGLSYKNMKSIYIDRVDVFDLTGISKYEYLEELHIISADGNIKNIRELKSLNNFDSLTLYISDTQEDFKLDELSNLRYLTIAGIRDISTFSHLPKELVFFHFSYYDDNIDKKFINELEANFKKDNNNFDFLATNINSPVIWEDPSEIQNQDDQNNEEEYSGP